MAQLLVRNISEALAKSLKQRAAEHGVSAEEEHRRILEAALNGGEKKSNEARINLLLGFPSIPDSSDDDDWIFDRKDPRNARPERRTPFNFDE